jgi:hypothetical protein
MSVQFSSLPKAKSWEGKPPKHKMHLTGGILPVKVNLQHPGVGSDPEDDPEPAPGK